MHIPIVQLEDTDLTRTTVLKDLRYVLQNRVAARAGWTDWATLGAFTLSSHADSLVDHWRHTYSQSDAMFQYRLVDLKK